MLKTNSKALKEKVRNYVIDYASDTIAEDEEYYIDCGYNGSNPLEAIKKSIVLQMKQNYRRTFRNMFEDYVRGCGSFLNIIEAHTVVKEWLEQSEQDARKYSNTRSEDLYIMICYREFMYLLGKESEQNEKIK